MPHHMHSFHRAVKRRLVFPFSVLWFGAVCGRSAKTAQRAMRAAMMVLLLCVLLCVPLGSASVLCGSSSCAKGTYCPKPDHGCLACPEGKFSSERDSPSCAVCAPGQYGKQARAHSCPSCPMGKYQKHVSRRSCHACEEGRYAPNPFASACHACPIGTYSLSGWYFCDHTCPAGRYQLQRTCPVCSAGRYSDKAGQRRCTACAAGHFSPKPSALSGNKACKACPKGQTSQDESFASKGKPGGTRCEPLGKPCPRGRFGADNGWTVKFHLLRGCPQCPAAKYNDELGRASCKVCKCKPGETRGSSLHRTWCACEVCKAGKYARPGLESKGCTPCAPGQFQSKARQASCSRCPKGKMTDLRTYGAKSCNVVCPAGKYSEAGGWVPEGQQCKTCPVGKYQDMHKQRSCHTCPCNVGEYQLAVKECSCLQCPAGRFSSQRRTFHCSACARGQAQRANGAQTCHRCPASKYSFGGKPRCLKCPSAAVVASEYPRFSSRGWTMCGAKGLGSSPRHATQFTMHPTPVPAADRVPPPPSAHPSTVAPQRQSPPKTAAAPTAGARATAAAPAVPRAVAKTHATQLERQQTQLHGAVTNRPAPVRAAAPHLAGKHPGSSAQPKRSGANTHYALLFVGGVTVPLVALASLHAWRQVTAHRAQPPENADEDAKGTALQLSSAGRSDSSGVYGATA
jgi:hypothetical protein